MTFSEIFIARFLELHFHFLPSGVNETKGCHLTVDGSNWFVSVALLVAMKRRTVLVLKLMEYVCEPETENCVV